MMQTSVHGRLKAVGSPSDVGTTGSQRGAVFESFSLPYVPPQKV